MTDDLMKRLRDLAEEWLEMCHVCHTHYLETECSVAAARAALGQTLQSAFDAGVKEVIDAGPQVSTTLREFKDSIRKGDAHD